MSFTHLQIRISQGLQGQRLDKVLAQQAGIESRAQAQHLIEQGGVQLARTNSQRAEVAPQAEASQHTECAQKVEGSQHAEGSQKTKGPQPLKASQKTIAGQLYQVQIPCKAKTELQAYDFKLSVVYEDNSLIVIDKPAGLVVHPAPGHMQDTLLNALLHRGYKFQASPRHKPTEDDANANASHNLAIKPPITRADTQADDLRAGIVHRLDKNTSGLLVVAKTHRAQQHLCEQFKRRQSIRRVYDCVVHGRVPESCGTITSHLMRHPQNRKTYCSLEHYQARAAGASSLNTSDLNTSRFSISSSSYVNREAKNPARLAITHYITQAATNEFSWLECRLETGRTHQIRVHMKELGHPVVGDTVYTTKKSTHAEAAQHLASPPCRLALHAKILEFLHPDTNKLMHFESPWPQELEFMKSWF